MQRTLYAIAPDRRGKLTRSAAPITCDSTLERHQGRIVWEEREAPHRTFILEERPKPRELLFREVKIEKFLW
ncbi:MAG: hypothetical protein IKE04_07820 [Oscillospiraceae bacterium]|nr:hypothetical protein [Oscillospiraceae bacterium]